MGVLCTNTGGAAFDAAAAAGGVVVVDEVATAGVVVAFGVSASIGGFSKTTARAARFTAKSPSSAQTQAGVLPLERGKAVGSVDGFC